MSLTPYVVAIIKCGYDGQPEGDYAPISCFTPSGPGYVLAYNADADVYLELEGCDACAFQAGKGLHVINVWDGNEWRIDYVEAPQSGYIVTGSKVDGSIFTTSSEIVQATPAEVDIWRIVGALLMMYYIARILVG